MKLRGSGVSPGIASGKALIIESLETPIFRMTIAPDAVAAEVARLDAARETAREQIGEMRDRVERAVGEAYARVFSAHLLILDDAQLGKGTSAIIERDCVNAEWALKTVVERLLTAFASIEDPYLRERGGDLEDVHARMQRILAGASHHHDLSELTEDTVVIARTLSPSDAALLNHEHVVAFCTDVGGRTSHTAILANALEIPAVVGLSDITSRVKGGDALIVDGLRGEVSIRPSAAELAAFERLRIDYARHEERMLSERNLPAVTRDGVAITLLANIEFPAEVETALRHGAHGIGLYRSEFLFLSRSPDLPSETDHLEAYEALARMVSPSEAVIRTLDLGGDKYFHEVLDKNEANPVMGMRAIRFCLRRQDIFRTQLRGLLRASSNANLKVMFPLVSGVAELRQAKQVLGEVREELEREGFRTNPNLKIGIMIEVPSAALVADRLAEEADFFSIGTNDLLQYCLALDRGNESVAYLYQPFHPALLRLMKGVIDAANARGIDVSLCGEMASDPLAVPVLVGLGLRKLSSNALSISGIRTAVRRIDAGRARRMVDALLLMSTAEDIEARVREEFPPVDDIGSAPDTSTSSIEGSQ